MVREFEIDVAKDDGYIDVGDGPNGGRKPDTPHVSDAEDEDDELMIDEGPGSARPVSIDTVPPVATKVSEPVYKGIQRSTLPLYTVMPPSSNIIGPHTSKSARFNFDVERHRLHNPISPTEVAVNQTALYKLQQLDASINRSSRFKGTVCWSGLFKLSLDPNYFAILSLDGFSDVTIPRSGVRLLSYLPRCPNILWTVVDPTGTRFYDGLDYIGTFLKRHLSINGRVSTSVVNFDVQQPDTANVDSPVDKASSSATTTTTTSTTTTSSAKPTGPTAAATTTATSTNPTETPPEPIRVAVTLETMPAGFPARLALVPKPPDNFDWSDCVHEVLSVSDRRIQFRRESSERLFPRLVRDYNGRCDITKLNRRRELEVQAACGYVFHII